MIRRNRAFTLSAAALTGALLPVWSASPALADTLCAASVGVSGTLASNAAINVAFFGTAPWIAGASYNGAGVGIVADAWQGPSGGAWVNLYNSNSNAQNLTGWALMIYRC